MLAENSSESPPSSSLFALKRIQLREQHPRHAKAIEKDYRITPLSARVLAARGYVSDERLRIFLSPTLRDGLPSPGKLKNIEKACELIAEAIKGKQSIAICCDFDVDGLSGGSQVFHFLTAIGARCHVFVPDRFREGYGLNEQTVRSIAEQSYGLLITIDFGTTNHRELALAKSLGLKTLVVDHHHVGEAGPPPADAFVNPQQEGCGFADGILCASGLAWYLIVALRKTLKGFPEIDAKSYLDLACLGTICDMVPLVGANRIIAKRGLELLANTRRPGLLALKRVIGIEDKLGCSHVSFGIGPRLNAAGRMVHGEMVIDLLTTSESQVAHKIARKLNTLNAKRQETEENVKQRAIKQILELGKLPAGLVVWQKDYHTGVIGIVAQRLVEAFHRPSVVMGFENGAFKGSVRGIRGFHVVDALAATGRYLTKFGGHEGAGGFSIDPERIEEFREAFVSECDSRLKDIELDPYAIADTEAHLGEIDVPLVNELKTFEPFGMGNPNPLVLIRDLKVLDVKVLKNAHLKAMLTDGRRYITGLMWRQTSHPAIEVGSAVNIVCKPDYNTFSGSTEIQAILQAVERI